MKGFQRLFLVFSILCFLLSAAAFASSLHSGSGSSGDSTAPAGADGSYVLKSEGDAIRIYSDTACTEQVGTLDVHASELPAEDRGLLECGLLIENEQQLLSLIEDYTG